MTSEKQQAVSLDNHKAALEERGELHIIRKKCEDRIKALDEELRPVLEGRGELVYAGYSFKVTLVTGRKTLDKDAVADALHKHGLDIANFEKVGAPYTTFTVKEVQSL